MLQHFAWSVYYDKNFEIEETIKNQDYTAKNESLHISLGDTYIYQCTFYDLEAYDGGAIFFDLADNRLLVEKCIINNCRATHYTAGIRALSGSSVIAFVCSQHGYADDSDGFYSTFTNSIHPIIDSSISYCGAKLNHIVYIILMVIHR